MGDWLPYHPEPSLDCLADLGLCERWLRGILPVGVVESEVEGDRGVSVPLGCGECVG
jgi:hypothetical protein